MSVHRVRNLDMIRWMSGGHEPLTKRLSAISNWTYISKMIHGQKEITDHTAREIERVLKLQQGWMDRDNLGLVRMSNLDYQIQAAMKLASDERKSGLLRFLSDV